MADSAASTASIASSSDSSGTSLDASFDLVIIGSGPGGYPAAIRASQLGMTVAVVEREELGGVTHIERGRRIRRRQPDQNPCAEFLTTLTTLLVVVTLFLRGGEVLNTFALCLIIGFIAGTYSTIFIASPLVLAWENRGRKK